MRELLRLLRIPLLPTALADVSAAALVAAALLGRDLHPGSVGLALLAAGATYSFGMVLNDWIGRDRDRVTAPDRPLALGSISPTTALLLALALAGIACAAAWAAGTLPATLGALAFAAAYDSVGTRRPALGALLLGGARAANATQGLLLVGAAALATPLAWAAPLASGLYGASVLLLSADEDAPSPRRRLVSRLVAIAAFLLAGTIGFVAAGRIGLGTIVALGALTSLAAGRTPRSGPIKRQVLEMLLGWYWLSFALCGACHPYGPFFDLVGLAVALGLSFLGQTLVRRLRPRAIA